MVSCISFTSASAVFVMCAQASSPIINFFKTITKEVWDREDGEGSWEEGSKHHLYR